VTVAGNVVPTAAVASGESLSRVDDSVDRRIAQHLRAFGSHQHAGVVEREVSGARVAGDTILLGDEKPVLHDRYIRRDAAGVDASLSEK
jgi:hypothetical protein